MKRKTAVIVSGYFNCLHRGHLELMRKAKEHGDELWVIVNNDLQRELKGSKEFMDQDERLEIIKALGIVDYAIIAMDKNRTVIESIRYMNVVAIANDPKYKLIFANGGDQDNETIPESFICKQLGISMLDGLGDKIQSSSWLLKK